MDFNLEVRLKQLESLEQYISSSRDKVQSILDCLKWHAKEVLKDSQLITCSVDPSHRVHSKSVDEHVKNCSLRREGYDLNEDYLSEPVHNTNSSILIDDHKKIEILSAAHRSTPEFKTAWNGQDPDPKTANRLVCTFSPEERLTLYTYAASHTVGPPQLPEFNTVQPVKSTDKPLTCEELRIRERDAKRRRIKYKSVHTNRKSHKEVLREVIEGQMEMYTDWLSDKNLVQSEEKHENNTPDNLNLRSKYGHDEQQRGAVTDYERGHSVVSKNSTHSGSSKSTSARRHSKDRYEHNHCKQYDGHDYRKHHKDSSRERSFYRKRRSRERYEFQKDHKSRSRHSHDGQSYYSHDNRSRYDGWKDR